MLKMIDPAQDLQTTVAESMRIRIWVWIWQNSPMKEKGVLPRMGGSPTMQKIPRDREERKQEEHVTPVSVHI